jgi:putative DNA primase/helicase
MSRTAGSTKGRIGGLKMSSASFEPETIDEINNSFNIVHLIGNSPKVMNFRHSSGGQYVGHTNNDSKSKASLKVNSNTGEWHDLAAGIGGRALHWIGYEAGYTNFTGNDFIEVVRLAAERAGIELRGLSEEEKGAIQEWKELKTLWTEAAETYHNNLKNKPELYDFIKTKWGLNKEIVDKYKIGYATEYKNLHKLNQTTLNKSGLVEVEGSQIKEDFHDRITFPYWKRDEVVYLAARATRDDVNPKYRKLRVCKQGQEYVSPLVQNSFFYGEDSVTGKKECVITEGVTDCLSMLQAGFFCISPVTKEFREEDAPKLIQLCKRLDTVYICNDNEENNVGRDGALKTAALLEKEGISVRIVILPRPEGVNKVDIAEYMKPHNADDFKKLQEESLGLWEFKLSLVKVPVKTLDRLKAFQKFIKEDLAGMKPGEWDIFVTNDVRELFKLKKGDIKEIIADNRPNPEILPDNKPDGLQDIPPDFKRFYEIKINRDGEAIIKLIYSEIAAYLTEKNNVLSYAETLYVYRDGIYKPGEVELKAEAQAIIKALDFKGSITESTREIIHYITYENPETNYPFNEYGNIIPVENGLLKLDFEAETADLIPYTADFKFNFKLPVIYDPAADPEPIDKVIRGYVDPEEREGDNGKGETIKLGYSDANILYQIPAQALLQMTGAATFKKAYILQGDAHAGKSSYLELINRTSGNETISDVSLQALVSDRFALADLEGKLLNCYDDLADIPLREGGIFKTLTGKYVHRIQRKGQQGYNATIKAVHVYTCNIPPTFRDSIANDTAFWERWEFINFINLFDIDPYFYDRVFTQENISGFFNTIIKTAMEIKKKGRLLIDSAAGEVREKWQSNADPLYKFIDGELNKEATKTINMDKMKFLKAFTKYCNDKNIDPDKIPGTVTMFTKILFKYEIMSKQIKVDGQQPWVYCLPYSWRDIKSPYYVESIAKETTQGVF